MQLILDRELATWGIILLDMLHGNVVVLKVL